MQPIRNRARSMQMSRNVVFHNFIPSSPLSTNVKLKGRPAPRLCQIKPISCCLKKKIKKIAGKQKTAEIHTSHRASTSFSLSPLPSFHLFPFLSVHSANGGYVKANSGSLSIKDFMCPIKKKKGDRMPSGVRGIISLSYNVCLEKLQC